MLNLKKILVFIFSCSLLIIFVSSCSSSKEESPIDSTTVLRVDDTIQYEDAFDYYSITNENEIIKLYATLEKKYVKEAAQNMGFEDDVLTDVTYSASYDSISQNVTIIETFCDGVEVLEVNKYDADMVFYGDGSYDAAIINENGDTIWLSEIMNGQIKNCFFGLFSFSIGAIIAAIATAAAKALIITTVAVVVLGVTYEAVKATKELIEERIQEVEEERRRNSEKIYYPSELKKANPSDKIEKLFIGSIAQDIKTAASAIKGGTHYWTAWESDAEKLAIRASGGAIGPECTQSGKVSGYYYHYHLLGRIGGHSFYGSPVGEEF